VINIALILLIAFHRSDVLSPSVPSASDDVLVGETASHGIHSLCEIARCHVLKNIFKVSHFSLSFSVLPSADVYIILYWDLKVNAVYEEFTKQKTDPDA
jgi:hypothetical protein